jgi:hypothetical protein
MSGARVPLVGQCCFVINDGAADVTLAEVAPNSKASDELL